MSAHPPTHPGRPYGQPDAEVPDFSKVIDKNSSKVMLYVIGAAVILGAAVALITSVF
jgi:hypothetical protein